MESEEIPQSIFHAYDIRGRYPEEVNEEVFGEIARHLGKYFGGKKIVIGHDTRLSSPKLYETLMEKIEKASPGLQIIDAGFLSTPMLYFLVNHFRADFGIGITASHNPKEYNGMKVIKQQAVPMSGEEIRGIISKY